MSAQSHAREQVRQDDDHLGFLLTVCHLFFLLVWTSADTRDTADAKRRTC